MNFMRNLRKNLKNSVKQISAIYLFNIYEIPARVSFPCFLLKNKGVEIFNSLNKP